MTPKTLFTPEELIAACQTAEEAGDDSLRSVFDIAPSARAAVNGSVHYLDLTARVPGKAGKLYVRFRNERLVGLILPLKGDPHESVRDPSRAPTLGIQKYKVGPDSEDPSRSALSPYFQVIAYLDRFFGAAVRRLLLDGDLHTKADAAEAPPGSLLIKSDSPIRLLQDAVSSASKTNPGMPLVNPITRITLRFDDHGEPRKGFEFFDLSTRRPDPAKEGGFLCDPLKFQGRAVCAANVHQIQAGSEISGVACLSACCASNMGISIPVSAECLFVRQPPPREDTWMADVLADC